MDVLGYLGVLLFVAALSYRLVFQVKRFKSIKEKSDRIDYRRWIFANCVESLSVGGLLVSMMLGVILRGLRYLRFDLAYSDALDILNMASLGFLCLFLIAFFIIEPGDHQKYMPSPAKRKMF